MRKACQGRPVDEDAIALLAQRVEETVRARGAAEIPSHEVGLAILGPLRELDEVAYLRFASVYRSFESLGDFEREIAGPAHGGSGDRTANRPRPMAVDQLDRSYPKGDQARRGAARDKGAGDMAGETEPLVRVGRGPWGRPGSRSSGCGPPRACTRTTR